MAREAGVFVQLAQNVQVEGKGRIVGSEVAKFRFDTLLSLLPGNQNPALLTTHHVRNLARFKLCFEKRIGGGVRATPRTFIFVFQGQRPSNRTGRSIRRTDQDIACVRWYVECELGWIFTSGDVICDQCFECLVVGVRKLDTTQLCTWPKEGTCL